MEEKTGAIGIDFGTSNCRVAVADEDGQVSVIKNFLGHADTPSYISFWEGEDHPLVGENAQKLGMLHPQSIVCDVLQLLGRDCNDPEIQQGLKYWPFRVVNQEGRLVVTVEDKTGKRITLFPEELAALLLTEMKRLAEAHLGSKASSGVVITIPNWFTMRQRSAILQAATMAGLEEVKLIPATTVAIIFNEFVGKLSATNGDERQDKLQGEEAKYVCTRCLGGGNWDTALWQVFSGQQRRYSEVWNNRLHFGGQTFDRMLTDEVVFKQEQSRHGLPVSNLNCRNEDNCNDDEDKFESLERFGVLQKCEKAKELVFQPKSTTIDVIMSTEEEEADNILRKTVSSTYFERIKPEYFTKYDVNTFDKILTRSNVRLDKALRREWILLGGMAANPDIHEYYNHCMEGWSLKRGLDDNHNEGLWVVSGAALLASTLFGGNNGRRGTGDVERMTLLHHRHVYSYKVSLLHGGYVPEMIYLLKGPYNLPAHSEILLTSFINSGGNELELKIYEELWGCEQFLGAIRIPCPDSIHLFAEFSVETELDVDCLLGITVSSSSGMGGYKTTFRYPQDFHDTMHLSPDQLNFLVQKMGKRD